jgi:hypothetical protein
LSRRWCPHDQRPFWNHVGMALHASPLRVCTGLPHIEGA